LLLSFIFVIAYAYGQEVHYNYKRGADLMAYKTYQWAVIPAAQNPDPPMAPPIVRELPNSPGGATDDHRAGVADQFIDQEIRCAIDEQLAQKGLLKVEKNGELQVIYHAAIHQEVSLNRFGSGWGGRGYSALWNGPVQGQSYTVPVGTLVVDLYDSTTNQLIWRGDAAKAIGLKTDPNKTYNKLQRAMAKLFNDYPLLQIW
jgi:hypothetical protein